MRKRILWIPQLATIDKQTNKVIINADSNITILNGMIENLSDDFSFAVIMPQECYCNVNYHEAISDKAKIFSKKGMPVNSFSLRYDFDFNEMIDFINHINPDVIVNNTSTLTKNIKAVIYYLRSEAKLVNFMHFLDHPLENKVPNEVSYFIRQLEGIVCSDLPVFQSYTVKSKALDSLASYITHDEIFRSKKLWDLEYDVWNATYSQKEVDSYEAVKPEKKRIIFPNRLSSTNYSNHLRFFEAIRNISETRDDFEVVVNNPTKYMTYEEIGKLCPNLKVLNDGNLLDRQQYFEALKSSDIGVALFTQEGHGGVSSKQFQAAGCLPVYPMVNEYAYLMPESYQGFCNVNLKDLEMALNYTLDICRTDKGKAYSDKAKELIYERDSFEANSKKVKESLIKLINGN